MKRRKSAWRIQAAWRGYVIRKGWAEVKAVAEAEKKEKERLQRERERERQAARAQQQLMMNRLRVLLQAAKDAEATELARAVRKLVAELREVMAARGLGK